MNFMIFILIQNHFLLVERRNVLFLEHGKNIEKYSHRFSLSLYDSEKQK